MPKKPLWTHNVSLVPFSKLRPGDRIIRAQRRSSRCWLAEYCCISIDNGGAGGSFWGWDGKDYRRVRLKPHPLDMYIGKYLGDITKKPEQGETLIALDSLQIYTITEIAK